MSIRIIKEGTRKTEICENCGCEFSYEEEDIHKIPASQSFMVDDIYVICPQCGATVDIREICIKASDLGGTAL